jgi:hypothetical protein
VQGTHGSQAGSQGLQTGSQGLQTGSHGEQAAGSQGLHFEYKPDDVVYTTCVASCVLATGKSEPVRHQLEPLEEQPTLTEDNKKATAQNNANFFMVLSPKQGDRSLYLTFLKGHADPVWSARHSTP